jgi:hypothetical protein
MAIVMDGETDSEYLKLTSFSELYTLKEWISWYVNYISV